MPTEPEFNWELDFPVIEPQINAQGVHVWPFDPSFPVDIRFFESGHHHGVRMNRHDYFELVYVYSGEASFQIQDRSFTVRGGDLVMIGSTLYHRQLARTDGVKDRVVVLIFKPELIRTATANGDDVEYLMPFYSQNADSPHVIPAETTVPAKIFELIKDMVAELPATSSRARLAVRTYLKMALILLVNHYADYLGTRSTFRDKQQSIKRLRPLFDWIDQHYADPVTVEDAAKICAMSASYFMRFFKEVTGESFLSYLNHFRIAKAQVLLATTGKSISEISQEIGFCDQSYFGMVFRKVVQTTPMCYRRRFAKPVSDDLAGLGSDLPGVKLVEIFDREETA